MDTGSGHDLVSRREIKALKQAMRLSPNPLYFNTANGETRADQTCRDYIDYIDEMIAPHVLENTLAVLSVGQRCMRMGYSFIWPVYERPYMVDPKGNVILLQVHNDIPYLTVDDESCAPRLTKQQRVYPHPLAPARGVPAHAEVRADSAEDAEVMDVGSGNRADSADEGEHRDDRDDEDTGSSYTSSSGCIEDDVSETSEEGRITGKESSAGSAEGRAVPMDDGERSEGSGNRADSEHDGEREEEHIEPPPLPPIGELSREAARGLPHLLTHKPKNPHCIGCRVAKMRDVPHYTGAFDRTPAKWGDLITCDHIDSRNNEMTGLHGEKNALVIKDFWSGLVMIYPAITKDGPETEEAIADFLGSKPCRRSFHRYMYSDQERAILKACRSLKLHSETSQAGVPRNNAMIERTVQDVLAGTRTLLRTAGLPSCFWTYASKTYCFLDNITPKGADLSPWMKTFDADYNGKKIPFGSKVYYLPNKTKTRNATGRWSTRTNKRSGSQEGELAYSPGMTLARDTCGTNATSFGTWKTSLGST